jgi:hypothetical protein
VFDVHLFIPCDHITIIFSTKQGNALTLFWVSGVSFDASRVMVRDVIPDNLDR